MSNPAPSAASQSSKPCIFCGVADKPDDFKIVWQDDHLIAFEDYRPAAKHHILVCPKKHINGINDFTKDDVETVRAMRDAGTKIMEGLEVPEVERRMGFNIPPFVLVGHLHLHVHAMPFNSTLSGMFYPISNWGAKHKGLSWFVEVDQAIAILESGQQVGVLPC